MTENEKENAALAKNTETEVLGDAVIVSDAAVMGDTVDDTEDALEKNKSGKDKPPSAEKTATSISKTNKLFMTLLVLIVLIVGSASALGWWFWQSFKQQISTLNQQQQVLLEEWQTSQNRIKSFEQLNSQTNADWKAGIQSLESMVVETAQRMNRQANRSADRWPLEEALTLARLAEQRLQLDANAQIAVGLLSAADKVFSGLDQAAVLPIRRQLATDILALQSTPAADVNGHYFKLDAIANQVKALQWVPKPTTQTDIPDNTDLASGFWHSLKQIVVVTRLDVPLEAPALQSDFERWRQHTLLLLEQTQLALLARNQALFDVAIVQVQNQLTIMAGQFRLAALQQSLTAMQGATLNPQWPNIGTSVEIIEQYLAELEPTDNAEVAQ